jgi:hypothetical protein
MILPSPRKFVHFLLLVFSAACSSAPEKTACPITDPLWARPPADAAVQGDPGDGYYFINEDRSIWASAGYTQQDEPLRMHGEGVGLKVGWFRPAGAKLVITGQRLDREAPPLEAFVPSGYGTRFQASALSFPSEGCWEVMARAKDKELIFVVWVEP